MVVSVSVMLGLVSTEFFKYKTGCEVGVLCYPCLLSERCVGFFCCGGVVLCRTGMAARRGSAVCLS